MLRVIGAVVLGYVVMAAVVFATFTAAYLAMGADGAFKAGTYDVTPLWLAVSLVLSLIAALLGGLVCARVARRGKASIALAGLVLVLGLITAFATMGKPKELLPAVRTGDVRNMEAMKNAKEPHWLLLLNPFVGVFGVLAGSRLKKDR
jgi:hypothetical protein